MTLFQPPSTGTTKLDALGLQVFLRENNIDRSTNLCLSDDFRAYLSFFFGSEAGLEVTHVGDGTSRVIKNLANVDVTNVTSDSVSIRFDGFSDSVAFPLNTAMAMLF